MLDAQKYCETKNIGVELTKDKTGWAIWISFPNGVDKVYLCYIQDDDKVQEEYWKACEYAADYWWIKEEEENRPSVPPVPVALKVPSVPLSVPNVPKIPLSVPKVPLSVPKVPINN